MITSIHIENFKSIQSLDLELGRLNVFIGANGSGKSNILEAIAMGSAAMEDKLDDEFLVNRGVRVTEPKLMESAFNNASQNDVVEIDFFSNNIVWRLSLSYTTQRYNRWQVEGGMKDDLAKAKEFQLEISAAVEDLNMNVIKLDKLGLKLEKLRTTLGSRIKIASENELNEMKVLGQEISEIKEKVIFFSNKFDIHNESVNNFELKGIEGIKVMKFLIYAPENHFLRKFEEESAIKPLGIKGEGLFTLITIIAHEYPEQFNKIKQHLKLIDWFEDFEIPGDLKFTERRIKIKDQYLADDLQYFDQRSANEGFLYLLFYLTLFVSDLTPHFFAIDNIDNALNPKLGSELIKVLAKLSKEHNKQALLTTHNPVILDGLDLNDDNQRLFVVYRNADGHTKVRRVPPLKPVNGVAQVRLSEAFIRGYIGGLPDNF